MSFYAARQPILNLDKTLFAYELLFRQSLENVFPQINDDQATAKLIEGLQFNLGLETLTKGTLAFINFTQASLLDGYPLLLPKEQIVVEILETAKPGKRLLQACIELKEKGYMLALDDYEHDPLWRHFFPYIDIIKLDYQLSTPEQIQQIFLEIKDFPHIKLLAEKIENYEEYQQAVALGCVYFQGYFFSKPEVIRSISFKPSQMSLIKLMEEINSSEPNLAKVTAIFESDVDLAFKLLRYAQSPFFKRASQIATIKQALVMLGAAELKRFISLLFTAQFSQGKPAELTVMSLVRARFNELMLTKHKGSEHSSAFLVGLLSLIDAMVDADIGELMEKLPIADEMKDALIKKQGEAAELVKLCEHLERAEWLLAEQQCIRLGYDHDVAMQHFAQALNWATERVAML
ncbi:MAG: EAL domain-containing protein [Paraglaciecola sp.]|nr:EAL domain-containing protein [Paraglaciecola sp.]NCT47148.1 EAL domain-containing protein [Paraglaciecola sp.]